MALDPIKNFAKGTLTAGIDDSATSFSVGAGEGARFPDPATLGAFNITIYNATDYPDPSDDPNREILRVTGISTDAFTVVRPASGNSYNGEDSDNTAKTHNTGGKTYKIVLSMTLKTQGDMMNNNNWLSNQVFS